jgi:hypothetical protein
MAHVLVLTTDKLDILPAILARWREIGVGGATVLRSVGSFRAASWLERVGHSMLGGAFDADELQQGTLFSVIEDDATLEAAIAEAERLIGGFDQPKNGILFVFPAPRVLGLHKRRPPSPAQLVASAPAHDDAYARLRAAPVETVLPACWRMPALVSPEAALTEVAAALVERPDVRIAGVVNAEGRLSGIIRLEALASDLFIEWLPEELLSRVADLDQTLQYADSLKHRTAADVMERPVSIHPSDSVREAFRRMQDARLPAIPLVDEAQRVIGCVGLLELLALFTAGGRPCVPSGGGER